jgi:hypothetical protein
MKDYKPYIEENISENLTRRTFASDVSSSELEWHRDKEDRIVKAINENDWMIQFDNELPRKIGINEEITIPKETFHRVIKGTSDLVVEINKNLDNSEKKHIFASKDKIMNKLNEVFNEPDVAEPQVQPKVDPQVQPKEKPSRKQRTWSPNIQQPEKNPEVDPKGEVGVIDENQPQMDLKPQEIWWENNPNELLGYVYWLQDQIPPTEIEKKKTALSTIAQQLNTKFPAPDGAIERMIAMVR